MSKNVKNHLPLLSFLIKAPPKICKIILLNSDDNLVRAIAEICLNFCLGNVKCEKKYYNKLRKFKAFIHKLAQVKKNQSHVKLERKLLFSKGSTFLPLLLTHTLKSISRFIDENTL